MTASATIDRPALLRRLSAAVEACDGDELAVVVLLAERLAQGRRTYGRLDLATDRRRFVGEAVPELLDAVAYLGMEAVRADQKGAGA